MSTNQSIGLFIVSEPYVFFISKDIFKFQLYLNLVQTSSSQVITFVYVDLHTSTMDFSCLNTFEVGHVWYPVEREWSAVGDVLKADTWLVSCCKAWFRRLLSQGKNSPECNLAAERSMSHNNVEYPICATPCEKVKPFLSPVEVLMTWECLLRWNVWV